MSLCSQSWALTAHKVFHISERENKNEWETNVFSASLYRRRVLWRKSNHVQYNLLDSLLELQLFKMIMHKSSSDREYIGMRPTNWPILLYQDTEPCYLQEKKQKAFKSFPIAWVVKKKKSLFNLHPSY